MCKNNTNDDDDDQQSCLFSKIAVANFCVKHLSKGYAFSEKKHNSSPTSPATHHNADDYSRQYRQQQQPRRRRCNGVGVEHTRGVDIVRAVGVRDSHYCAEFTPARTFDRSGRRFFRDLVLVYLRLPLWVCSFCNKLQPCGLLASPTEMCARNQKKKHKT